MTNMFKINNRFPHWHVLYPMLGINSSILPKEGFESRTVNGVEFKCNPAPEKKDTEERGYYGRCRHSSKHRLFYRCSCDVWVPFGRACQHKC